MMLSLILGFLCGALLGGRFRVFVLLPVQIMAVAVFAAATVLAGWPLGWAFWAFCAWSVALQGGYVFGLLAIPHANARPRILTSNL